MNQSLVAARRAKGWSQRQAATEAGISPTHWAQLETGVREPSARVMRQISTVLGVPVGRLFFAADSDSTAAPSPAPDSAPKARTRTSRANKSA